MNPVTKARAKHNMTQQQLADRLGVNIRTVQRWESQSKVAKRIALLLTTL